MPSTIVCLVVGLASIAMFWKAHSYLDRSEPLAGPAAALLGGIILLAVAALAFVLPSLANKRRLIGYSLVVAIPLALLEGILASVYDAGGNLLVFILVFFLIVLLFVYGLVILAAVVVGIVALVLWISREASPGRPERLTRRSKGLAAAFIAGWGVALAHALAALYLLATLPNQVEAARDAHEAPGLAFLATTATLVGVTLWHRRRSPPPDVEGANWGIS